MSEKKKNKTGFYIIKILIAEIGEENWKKLTKDEQEEKIIEKRFFLKKEAPIKRKELKDKNKQYRGKIDKYTYL